MNLSETSLSSTLSSGSRNSRIVGAAVDIIAGFTSRQLCFIHGEHHMNASILFYSYTALAVAVSFLELRIDDKTYRGPLQNTAFLIRAYTSTLFTSIIIYRAYFHRLHSFPGPFLARVLRLWHVYRARHSQNHQLLLRLHKDHGTFVRTGKQNTHTSVHVDLTTITRSLWNRSVGPRSEVGTGVWSDMRDEFTAVPGRFELVFKPLGE